MWLDFAEDQTRRRQQVFLDDWQTRLEDFLRFNDRRILQGAGKVSKTEAENHAREQYQIFNERRRHFLEAEGARGEIQVLEDLASNDSE